MKTESGVRIVKIHPKQRFDPFDTAVQRLTFEVQGPGRFSLPTIQTKKHLKRFEQLFASLSIVVEQSIEAKVGKPRKVRILPQAPQQSVEIEIDRIVPGSWLA